MGTGVWVRLSVTRSVCTSSSLGSRELAVAGMALLLSVPTCFQAAADFVPESLGAVRRHEVYSEGPQYQHRQVPEGASMAAQQGALCLQVTHRLPELPRGPWGGQRAQLIRHPQEASAVPSEVSSAFVEGLQRLLFS